jgi:hypothetical protein
MRRIALKILPAALLLGSIAFAQSLGDVARQNREKQKAKAASSASKPTVITNDTLPSASQAMINTGENEPSEAKVRPVSSTTSAARRSAEEWKNLIVAQKNAIAAQQAQIDKLSDSVHFVAPNAVINGIQYNEHQEKRQELVTQMRHQLEEQKKNLADLQEAARRAGMGNAVYDP